MGATVILGVLALLSATGERAFAEPAEERPIATPDYYVGIGVRALARDPTALVLAGKARLVSFGQVSASARAAVLYGDYLEGRAPLTLEAEILDRFSPFFGGGVAYGTDGLGRFDPMLSAGMDIAIAPWLSLNMTAHYIFQLEANDDDKEIMGVVAFAF